MWAKNEKRVQQGDFDEILYAGIVIMVFYLIGAGLISVLLNEGETMESCATALDRRLTRAVVLMKADIRGLLRVEQSVL